MRRVFLALLSLAFMCGLLAPAAHATVGSTKNKGLYISPLRTYTNLDAGTTITRSFTVANLSDQPMTVTAHIEQFSVADYSYDYQFNEPDNNWISLVENKIVLKPNESHQLAYHITLPKDAAPGGHYYTFYASSEINNSSTKSTLQAATLLYLTVNGPLHRSSQIVGQSLPRIVVTPDINYWLDIKDTGNVHYFAYVTTAVDGLLYHDAPNGYSELLMPGAVRRITSSIKSPVLPGIYRLSYSYTPDQGSKVTGSHYFLFLPPWSIALLILVIAFFSNIIVRRIRRKKLRK